MGFRKGLSIALLPRLPLLAADTAQTTISNRLKMLRHGRASEVVLNTEEKRELRFNEMRFVKTKLTRARKWTIGGQSVGYL